MTKMVYFIIFLFQMIISSNGQEAPVLNLLYMNRPPYYMPGKSLNDLPHGLIMDRVHTILKTFPGAIKFKNYPSKRQLQYLKSAPNTCGIGWFKNSDREKDYRFSYEIYNDKEMVLIVRKEHLSRENGVIDLLKSKLKFIIKDGFSYGESLDNYIKKMASVERVNVDQVNIVDMLELGRGEATILSQDEKEEIFDKKKTKNKDNYMMFPLREITGNIPRYLMCSKTTNDKIMNMINEAISQFYKKKS